VRFVNTVPPTSEFLALSYRLDDRRFESR